MNRNEVNSTCQISPIDFYRFSFLLPLTIQSVKKNITIQSESSFTFQFHTHHNISFFFQSFFTFSNSSSLPEDWIKNILPCHILSLTFFLHLYFSLTRFFLIPLLPSSFVTLLFFQYFVPIVVFFLPPFSRMFNCTYCPILARWFLFFFFTVALFFIFLTSHPFFFLPPSTFQSTFFFNSTFFFPHFLSFSLSPFKALFSFHFSWKTPYWRRRPFPEPPFIHLIHSLIRVIFLPSSFTPGFFLTSLPYFLSYHQSLFLRRQSSSSYSSLSFHFPIPFFLIETISGKNIL